MSDDVFDDTSIGLITDASGTPLTDTGGVHFEHFGGDDTVSDDSTWWQKILNGSSLNYDAGSGVSGETSILGVDLKFGRKRNQPPPGYTNGAPGSGSIMTPMLWGIVLLVGIALVFLYAKRG